MAGPSNAELVKRYIMLREHKAEAKRAFDESMARVNAGMEKIEGIFLDQLNETESESIKTEFGTFYKKTVVNASVADRPAFEDWCRKTGNTAAMTISANKKIVRELMDSGTEVPGINYSTMSNVGVRRKS